MKKTIRTSRFITAFLAMVLLLSLSIGSLPASAAQASLAVPVTNESELRAALSISAIDEIVLMNTIYLSNTLAINRTVTFSSNDGEMKYVLTAVDKTAMVFSGGTITVKFDNVQFEGPYGEESGGFFSSAEDLTLITPRFAQHQVYGQYYTVVANGKLTIDGGAITDNYEGTGVWADHLILKGGVEIWGPVRGNTVDIIDADLRTSDGQPI